MCANYSRKIWLCAYVLFGFLANIFLWDSLLNYQDAKRFWKNIALTRCVCLCLNLKKFLIVNCLQKLFFTLNFFNNVCVCKRKESVFLIKVYFLQEIVYGVDMGDPDCIILSSDDESKPPSQVYLQKSVSYNHVY